MINYNDLASKVLSLAPILLDDNKYYKEFLDVVFQGEKILNGWNLFKIKLKNGYMFTCGKKLKILIMEKKTIIYLGW